MTTSAPRTTSKGGLPFVAIALIVLLISGASSGILLGGAPGVTRLAAPIVCPSGTSASVAVVEGSTKTRWYFYCLDGDGVGREPAGVFVFFTLFGEMVLVIGGLVALLRLTAKRKA